MGFKVLSLFDGISCGKVALERAGISVDKYYASEIDKFALAVSKARHDDIIQLGDITTWQSWDIDLGSIDLLIGGSPCQGFSIAGKQLNFADPRSKLLFEYIGILNAIKAKNPNVLFLLENVPMKDEYKSAISNCVGAEPIVIDSALLSAQRRKRIYWTNIQGVSQPKDKGIMLKDIVHEYADMDKAVSDGWCNWFTQRAEFLIQKSYVTISPKKAATMTARQFESWNGNFVFEWLEKYIVPFDKTLKILDKEVERGKIGYFNKDSQGNRVYYIHDKAVTLCGEAGGWSCQNGAVSFWLHHP